MKTTRFYNPHIKKKGFTVPDSIYSVCKLNSYKISRCGLTFKCARWYSKRTFAFAMLSTVPTNTKGTWPSSRGIVGCGSLSPSILTRTWNKHRWKTMVHFKALTYQLYVSDISKTNWSTSTAFVDAVSGWCISKYITLQKSLLQSSAP